MLLIVVPVGVGGTGAGGGVGLPLEDEPEGGAVGDAFTAAVLLGTEAVAPHPASASRNVPERAALKIVRGTQRIF
ncbi:MAG TPA: hypothetical protein VFQ00_04525 [Terriglobales bacterium]|nr:hypothetical protein [Terriglobales bacterium]